MSPTAPLRIGLFTHSTNPRGGVVHMLELGHALKAMGQQVVVHAPDENGRGFEWLRPIAVPVALVPAAPAPKDLAGLVRQRVREFLAYLRPRGCEFDLYHASDGISGTALADLVKAGIIPGFVRTVHHLDEFADRYLRSAQERSITAASAVICVSRMWAERVAAELNVRAEIISNGVNIDRFTSAISQTDSQWIDATSGTCCGPIFLSVGGVERRKNSVNILRAFLLARPMLPSSARLVVAGGASLLDHSAYRREFDQILGASGAAESVNIIGPITSGALTALYRRADALIFPSLMEGFGLAVLEAMASGTPVVTSRQPPFTDYLAQDDAVFVDPADPREIAGAMQRVLNSAERARLTAAGLRTARRFSWSETAARTLCLYRQAIESWRMTYA